MNIPLSLYIHIPWCIRKCPYCDFNSHTLRDAIPEQEYIAKLLADLETHRADIQDRPIHSIFIGGGTPSLFSAAAYQRLFKCLAQSVHLPKDIEITLEANPGASDIERFYGFREAGINRLSLGVQSWHPTKLQALGRIHNAEQAADAVKMAKQAGFANFNIDIMHGLPGQSIAEAMDDLYQTIQCQPKHISWYQLTLEPNTYFHRFPPTLPEEEILWEIQEQGKQLLQANGFKQYEVSAYSQEGFFSRHNHNYWLFGDYIGIGAGAHSKITNLQHQSVCRSWKVKNPKDYLETSLVLGGTQIISRKELLFEFLMNAFRLNEKIPFSLLIERTALAKEEVLQTLTQKIDSNLLQIDSEYLALTPQGQKFLNTILTGLL